MRTFSEIKEELNLMLFTESENGDLYCVPVAPGAKRLIVRRFNRRLTPSMIPAYVKILADAAQWIERDESLRSVLEVAQPIEVGIDFIARRHYLGTSLAAYLETDPDEDPPEAPPELAKMQKRFEELMEHATRRDLPLISVLELSILKPTYKTIFQEPSQRFVIVDLKLAPADLLLQ